MEKQSYWPTLIIIFLILFGLLISDKYFEKPIPQPEVKAETTIAPLAKIVQDSLNGTKGRYGIVVKNLKTNESYGLREHEIFSPGSLYKLWVMGVAFEKITNNTLDPTEELTGNIADLNREFNVDELKSGRITLTIKNALEQMITISHNYAAFLLTKKVKYSSITPFLQKYEFNESGVGEITDTPKTTPYDMALYFEKLYKNQFASSSAMLDLLKRQTLNDDLPKYLPPGTIVAHKTGTIDKLENDAGIVFTSFGDYIIVIMTESDMPGAAQDRIAQVSKAVFDYFGTQNL